MTESSGNHGIAIAYSSQILGIDATIIMPYDATQMKVDAVKSYGAKIIRYDRYKQDAQVLGKKMQEEKGMAFISSFGHPDVVAG